MANDYDVIYIDDDGRNARPLVQDNRRPVTAGAFRPGTGIMVPPSTRPTLVRTTGTALRPSYAPSYAPAPTTVYYQSAPAQAAGLAGMTVAELVDVGAQVLAALQPLPGAPVAAGDIETDVENLVIYQGALATHAKRDEQLRTLGGLLGRLLRK
jgi:hypothetical protein